MSSSQAESLSWKTLWHPTAFERVWKRSGNTCQNPQIDESSPRNLWHPTVSDRPRNFMKIQYIHVKLTNWVIVMKESVTSNCSWRTRTVQCMSSWQSDSSWRNVWHGMHFVSFISSWFGARRKLQKSCTAGNTRCSSLSAGNVTRYPGEILLVVSCEELPWMEPRMSSPSRCSLKLVWKSFLLVVTGYILHTRAHRSRSFKKVWVCKDCTVDKSLTYGDCGSDCWSYTHMQGMTASTASSSMTSRALDVVLEHLIRAWMQLVKPAYS